MLYFSKIKIIFIYLIIIILSFFALSNFFDADKDSFIKKKLNLGLDLQGGSYLLLEIDTNPIEDQKLQLKLLGIRSFLKENNIKYRNLKVENKKIIFESNENDYEKFIEFFFDKQNKINSYYEQFKSFELEHSLDNNIFKIFFSKYALIEIKNSSPPTSLICCS